MTLHSAPERLPRTLAGGTQQRLAVALLVASGFAGLGYQIVWTQQSAIWLGHESAAVLAVVAAFFGGLALGAWAWAPRIAQARQPQRWYAGCELVIAAWSLALVLLMAPLGEWLAHLAGPQPDPVWQWSMAFLGTFVLLLPATAAMGATLPAMERVLAALRVDGRSIAILYASNTLGAMLGVLAAAFWLVPEWGLIQTTLVCAALNLVCVALAWGLRVDASPVHAPLPDVPAQRPARHHAVWLVATGCLGIGYEVLVVRVLSQVAENTVYTFAMLLAVYLAGTAAGAAAYQRWLSGHAAPDALRHRLLCALAASCVLATVALYGLPWLNAAVRTGLPVGGMVAALAGEAAMALVAFALPTVVMGALFSHLTTQARDAGMPLGRSLALNTAGAALAPWLFGVLLLPAVGALAALLWVAVGYLVLALPGVWAAWRAPPAARAASAAGAAMLGLPLAAALGVMVWAPPLGFVDVPEGGRLVALHEGTMATVSVVEDAQGVLRLRIDNRQQEGSSHSYYADARQAVLPLLLHPAPRSALFLGLGTGVTASAATAHPTLQVDAVELLPDVIAASDLFKRETADGVSSAAARLHVMAADARRFVRASPKRYDVIVSDNFHPARSGSGSLYTVEHFSAVRQRLAETGLFVQWLPLHQMDLPTLQAIVQSFLIVYPDALALLATNSLDTPTIGLVGRAAGGHFDLAQVRASTQAADAGWTPSPATIGLPDEWAVLGSFFAGPAALARFAGAARANTDDRPVVAYRAPRITYAPDSRPRDRLVELTQALTIEPSDVLGAGSTTQLQTRLAAYHAARTRYLDIGRNTQPSADVRRMLGQLQEPLLDLLRTSPDFRPAYDPLLQMAMATARHDAPAAKALLMQLAQVQPARADAAQALADLGASKP